MKTLIKNTGWKVEEILNPFTNKLENLYYYQNYKALRIKLDSKIASNYAGWVLLEKDIRNIRTWLDIFKDTATEIFVKIFHQRHTLCRTKIN